MSDQVEDAGGDAPEPSGGPVSPLLDVVAGILRDHGATAAGVDTDTLAARIVGAVNNASMSAAEQLGEDVHDAGPDEPVEG